MSNPTSASSSPSISTSSEKADVRADELGLPGSSLEAEETNTGYSSPDTPHTIGYLLLYRIILSNGERSDNWVSVQPCIVCHSLISNTDIDKHFDWHAFDWHANA